MTDDRQDDLLRELARDLPYEAPSEARRESVRASLLAQADLAQVRGAQPSGRPRWRVVAAFGAGALAAAAAAIVIVRSGGAGGSGASAVASDDHVGSSAGSASFTGSADAHAVIEASSAAEFEHTTRRTPAGADEELRVHAGHLRLAVAGLGEGDRVRLVTGDAEVAGAGVYEVTVAHDSIRDLAVRSGGAMLKVNGSAAVFLAAGQTWHAAIETASLDLPSAVPVTASASATVPAAAAASVPVPVPASVATPHAATSATVRETRVPSIASSPRISSSTTSSDPRRTSAVAPTNDARAPMPNPINTPSLSPATVAPTTIAPATTASSSSAPVAISSTATPPPPPARAAPLESPIEQRFSAGWAAFRAGDFTRAAAELGAAADAGEAANDPIALDARYQQAVALVRAGHAAAAERAAAQFLARADHSPRRGRAQLLLGRLLAARGDRDGATIQLRAASADADPTVASAAQTALAAIAPK